MDIPRIAVVGMGGFARTHLRYVKQVEEAGLGRHVAQVAIPGDQETFADQVAGMRSRDIAVYASLREMLAAARDETDLVCIPTGIPLHRPMTVAALEAGCHVLVEKPAAGSIQDVDAMLAAEQRTGRLCAVGFQHLYNPEFQQVKEWICQGRLGQVRQVKASGCWPRDPEYYGRNGWAGHLAVGDAWVLDSPHNNALGHAVNTMCYLACPRPGEALVPVSLQAELYRANAIESADTAVFRARSEEGTEIFFAVSHCADRNVDPLFVISGEKGGLELGYHGGIRIEWAEGREETHAPEGGGSRVLEDVVEVLAGRRESPSCPLAVTRSQTLCICGTFESSAIHEIAEDWRIVNPESGAVVVREMTQTVQRAFEEGALFSELDIPWARSGDEISLEDYAYFPTYRRKVGR